MFLLFSEQVNWFSTYRVHHRMASRFRVGSVFPGDAGHVHSPVGGQGMNTGLQDAHNLALLLTDITQGRRVAGPLDCYERERQPFAERLVKVTDRAFGIIGRRSFAASLLRNRASGLGGPSSRASRAHGLVHGWRLPRPVPPPLPVRSMTWQMHTNGAGQINRPGWPAWVNMAQLRLAITAHQLIT